MLLKSCEEVRPIVDGATLDDPGGLSRCISGILLYPLSDELMSLLRDLRGGCLPGADSPHRLVRDDNLAPVLDACLKSVKLYL